MVVIEVGVVGLEIEEVDSSDVEIKDGSNGDCEVDCVSDCERLGEDGKGYVSGCLLCTQKPRN